jgi:hypothetical protein
MGQGAAEKKRISGLWAIGTSSLLFPEAYRTAPNQFAKSLCGSHKADKASAGRLGIDEESSKFDEGFNLTAR